MEVGWLVSWLVSWLGDILDGWGIDGVSDGPLLPKKFLSVLFPLHAHALQVGPQPTTFGGQRRLIGHRNEPLLLEVVMERVISRNAQK